MAKDYTQLAKSIVELVGGEENVECHISDPLRHTASL